MKKLVIYGTGLISEVAEFFYTNDTEYDLVAFTNASDFIGADQFRGKPLVPFESLISSHPPDDFDIFIALGYGKTNQVRQARYLEAKAMGYECASYISSRSTYFGTPVGSNSFILENNVIQPFVKIEDNVTLWSGNHIGHHSIIRSHCFVSSHVVVSGGCDIGENCFLGVNATLRDNIKLGKFVVVGAGAIVLKDCADRTLVRPSGSEYKVVNKDLI
jgi:sugar O-acyltransferase (sialic acid O-acetyltransferase NeuD family)